MFPTLTWEGPDGEVIETRPDTNGGSFEMKVPMSIATGAPYKLVKVTGVGPEAVVRLMRSYR